MTKFSIICILSILFSIHGLFAQTKNEKESRVKLIAFPDQAQTVLKTVPKKAKRVRYYKETDGEKESFESKFKFKNFWFSVEFDTSGALEDIEVTIKEKRLQDTIKAKLNGYFKRHSEKFEIVKIQEQYLYKYHISEEKFMTKIFEERDSQASNYEVIVAIKQNKEWLLKEVTFDVNGDFLSTRILEQSSYEYIMY